VSVAFAIALLGFVTLQRLAELVIAQRNTRRLIAEGAVEVGASHYPLIVAVHVGWLAALWWQALSGAAALWWPALVAYLALQPLRLWVMASLGRFWTTRIVIPAGAPLVQRGPYRWLKHPNYCVVTCEIALLPLALGSAPLAIGFSLANLAVLAWRIRIEESALAPRRASL
jgi:methyltransferase